MPPAGDHIVGDTYRTVKRDLSVAVGSAVVDSEVINIRESVLLSISVPTGSSITSITWYACHSYDGTYVALEYPPGTAVASAAISAPVIFQAPDGLASHPYIKAVGNAAGTISVSLKS